MAMGRKMKPQSHSAYLIGGTYTFMLGTQGLYISLALMERFRSAPRFFLICLLNDRERGRRIGIF